MLGARHLTLSALLPAPAPAQEEASLLVAGPAKFKNWFNIDVKESTEVVSIDWCCIAAAAVALSA